MHTKTRLMFSTDMNLQIFWMHVFVARVMRSAPAPETVLKLHDAGITSDEAREKGWGSTCKITLLFPGARCSFCCINMKKAMTETLKNNMEYKSNRSPKSLVIPGKSF